MLLFKICFWFMMSMLIWHLLTKKFLNPFKFTMVVGKKGSGKTTWMVQLIYKYLKRGWKVYANIDIPGVEYFNPLDICKYTFPSGSAVFIDEANLYWDNRRYKDTAASLIEWFRYQRQYKVRVYMFSQTFDLDKKLRALCDDLYLVKNVGRVFCWCKRIQKWPDLKQAEGEGEARIVDMIKYDSILWWPFGSRHLVYIPKWSKHFRSYNPPPLPIIPSEYKWDESRAPKWLIRRKKLAALIDLRKERRLAKKTGTPSGQTVGDPDDGTGDLGSELSPQLDQQLDAVSGCDQATVGSSSEAPASPRAVQ